MSTCIYCKIVTSHMQEYSSVRSFVRSFVRSYVHKSFCVSFCPAVGRLNSVPHQLSSFCFLQPDKPRNTTLQSSAPLDTVTANDSVTFNCSTDANPPAHTFNFYFKGSMIVHNGTVKIQRVKESDQGKYTCAPSNILGRGENASVVLTVLGKSHRHRMFLSISHKNKIMLKQNQMGLVYNIDSLIPLSLF